jgi:hypothetical protein
LKKLRRFAGPWVLAKASGSVFRPGKYVAGGFGATGSGTRMMRLMEVLLHAGAQLDGWLSAGIHQAIFT